MDTKKTVSAISEDRIETKPRRDEVDFQVSLDEYLYNLLLHNGPMTRGQLVKMTNTPRTTIYDHLVKLQLKDKVVKFSKSNNKPGRPKVYFKANPQLKDE